MSILKEMEGEGEIKVISEVREVVTVKWNIYIWDNDFLLYIIFIYFECFGTIPIQCNKTRKCRSAKINNLGSLIILSLIYAMCVSCSVVSDSVTPWTARLLCPWDSPGESTGVGCISYSRGSSWSRDQTWGSCIAGRFFTYWATREALTSNKRSESCRGSLKDVVLGGLDAKSCPTLLRPLGL